MNKDAKINERVKHFIENGICHTKKGYTTGMLLYEKSENNIMLCVIEKSKKGLDGLNLTHVPTNEFTPDAKAILIILPFSEESLKSLKNKPTMTNIDDYVEGR